MTDNGPESWKTKCGIRRSEEVVPMTDAGTLIMRNSPVSTRRARSSLQQTRHYHAPAPHHPSSIAPFALDLEDHEEPARNSDALGTLRHTSQFDYARSTTNTSFWSGLAAGLATLGVGIAIGFTAFTAEPAVSYGTTTRDRHIVTHTASSLGVETVELAETKAAPPKKKAHRARRVVSATTEELPDTLPILGSTPAPEPIENE
ncbi:MAG: hypothetical protein U0270_13030 [Labilithrix sp.]